MRTMPNVSLVRETAKPEVYLIVGDLKLRIADEAEFELLGFRWPKVLVVADGTLDHLTASSLRAPAPTRPSDVFFDCGEDFDSITGRWHFNCQKSASLVRRDVLVAGWLYRPNPAKDADQPFVHMEPHGIEDIYYNVRYDSVFLDRMYGPGGLSGHLADVVYPGNPADVTPLSFAAAPPLIDGLPTAISISSWILPDNNVGIHGELNAWHRYNTGALWSRHFVGRGDPPELWINPFPADDGAYFPFHPLNPDGRGRNLKTGDYVLMRGPLWQDQWHGDPRTVLDRWDVGLTRHHAWLEMHPIDWIVRATSPTPNARTTSERVALLSPDTELSVSIEPDFPPSAPARRLEVRTVERHDDLRPGMQIPGALQDVQVSRQLGRVDVTVKITQPGPRIQGRFKGNWVVGWRELSLRDRIWVDEGIPEGADEHGDNEGWDWVSSNPEPFHETIAHQSALVQGIHQHYFVNDTRPMAVDTGDTLFAAVYLDPASPPDEVMLQWRTSAWLHRAYWGGDRIGWGAQGTSERRAMGRLPFAGEWVLLEVPAAKVGLDGALVTGMAFTLFDGRATWDYAGVRGAEPKPGKSGRLGATINPSPVRVARGVFTVRAYDTGDLSPVSARVLLDGKDIAGTDVGFQLNHPTPLGGIVVFVVRRPGYADGRALLAVTGPR